jgi:hypothetical protein
VINIRADIRSSKAKEKTCEAKIFQAEIATENVESGETPERVQAVADELAYCDIKKFAGV